jgi:CelD/BcsL family acetyltransferase involved in cellulose biosynthesis
MHIRPIRSLEEWTPLKSAMNALSGDVPFRRYEWLAAWWRHFGPGICGGNARGSNPAGELLVLAVHDSDGALVGMAPWYISRSLADGRAIRFLGSGIVCSDYLTLLARDGQEADVAWAVADWLAARTDLWDLIELSGVDAQDIAVPELGRRLQGAGNQTHFFHGPNCWRAELPKTWDGFLGRLAASKRQRARRLQRRLLDTGRASIRAIDNMAGWDEGFAIFHQLHQKRRTSIGDPGCFATPEFGRFLNEAGRDLLQSGHAVMLVLEIDGTPAAAEYNLLGGGIAYFYQAGIDPDRLADQPGHMLTAARIERIIQRGYRALDFLRGDEPYKSQWGAKPRPLMTMRVVRRRPAARLRHQVWVWEQQARRLARRSLSAAEQLGRKVQEVGTELAGRAQRRATPQAAVRDTKPTGP